MSQSVHSLVDQNLKRSEKTNVIQDLPRSSPSAITASASEEGSSRSDCSETPVPVEVFDLILLVVARDFRFGFDCFVGFGTTFAFPFDGALGASGS